MSKPHIQAHLYEMFGQIQGASLIDPTMAQRFARPPTTAFDAPWQDYKGLGMSISRGVAVLEIIGPLGFKLSWWRQGYDEISELLSRLRQNADVHSLLMNIHSPGGLVSGCFDLVDEIYELRQEMPVKAIVADCACSAAYALASAAEEVVITQTGQAGSIGVLLTHFNRAKQMKDRGVEVTELFAGEEKTLGSPYQSLSKSDRAKLQAEIDSVYEIFVGKVDRNRPNLSAEQIIATEAAIYQAEEAVEAGLCDRVLSGRELLAEMQQQQPNNGGASVTRTSTTTEANMPNPEDDKAASEAESKARDEAAVATKERIKAILSSDEAQGREEMANHLAFEQDMDAEAAIALLATAPKAEAQSTGQTLEQRMAAEAEHGIAPEAGADVTGAASGGGVDLNANVVIDANKIFADRAAVTGTLAR